MGLAAYRRPVIGAVIFDLDETLLDRTTSLRAFLADQYMRYRRTLGKVDFEQWQDRFLALDQRGHVHKTLVYPAILSEFGGEHSAALALYSDYKMRCSAFAAPFDGMAEALRSIQSRRLPMGIVTNGETDFQTKHIEALGLNRIVQAVLISEKEGLRKPDPLLFRRAADRLGVSPSHCLFVGDNPVVDILGAAATGMTTAWFSAGADWPTNHPANPGAVIKKLDEVLGILDGPSD